MVAAAADALARWCGAHPQNQLVVPALGCGLGGLDWATVRRLLSDRLAGTDAVLIPPR